MTSPTSSVVWLPDVLARADDLGTQPDYARSTALYRECANRPEPPEGIRVVRVGILRNVTVEPWLPALFVALLQRRLFAVFWLGDYDVVEPHLMDGSIPELDLLWLHLDSEVLVGDAKHLPDEQLETVLSDRLRGLVGQLASIPCPSVVSTLAPPPVALHTTHGDQDPFSWNAIRKRLNQRLEEDAGRSSSTWLLDVDRMVATVGTSEAYDPRVNATSRSPWSVSFLSELGTGLAALSAALFGSPKKCVVVDCDNTLWGGVLGEDGVDGVRLGGGYPGSEYRSFQFFLKGLERRGFLLAINSKNNDEDVVDFFERSPDMVLSLEDFAARRINWQDKATNLQELASELNVGLDSFVFIDDSPVECAWVREALPEVQVEHFPSDPLAIAPFVASIQGLERLAVTDADRGRTESIRANVERERLRAEAPDMENFVRSLGITLTVSRQDSDDVERISQLTQRTNQFNVTTHRYTPDDIRRWMERGTVYSMRMRDRFSDYGTIAVVISHPDDTEADRWVIDTFLLSCRAFGRSVESALLEVVLDDIEKSGATTVVSRYLRTPKNPMTRDFFPSHGFSVVFEADDERTFSLDLPSREASSNPPIEIVRVGF